MEFGIRRGVWTRPEYSSIVHPHAKQNSPASNKVLVSALIGLTLALLVSACSGPGSLFNSSAPSTSLPAGSGTTTPIAPQGKGVVVANYAQAVLTKKANRAAAPATAAALYLDYLARGELVGANVDFEQVNVTSDGFELRIGGVEYTFSDLKISSAGVEDVTLNGIPLSDRLAKVNQPIDLDGVTVESGVSYLTGLGHRIVILTVLNQTTVDLIPDPSLSGFLQNNGTRMVDLGTLDKPSRISSGGQADVAFISERGKEGPDGLLTYVFRTDDGDVRELKVPLGKVSGAFFQADGEGSVRGKLSSDIAFANGSAVLAPGAVTILAAAAEELSLLAEPAAYICVQGHADSVGSVATNQALSTGRAAAVRDELVRLGVTSVIDIVGHGEIFAPGDELPDPDSRRVDVRLERCS